MIKDKNPQPKKEYIVYANQSLFLTSLVFLGSIAMSAENRMIRTIATDLRKVISPPRNIKEIIVVNTT